MYCHQQSQLWSSRKVCCRLRQVSSRNFMPGSNANRWERRKGEKLSHLCCKEKLKSSLLQRTFASFFTERLFLFASPASVFTLLRLRCDHILMSLYLSVLCWSPRSISTPGAWQTAQLMAGRFHLPSNKCALCQSNDFGWQYSIKFCEPFNQMAALKKKLISAQRDNQTTWGDDDAISRGWCCQVVLCVWEEVWLWTCVKRGSWNSK